MVVAPMVASVVSITMMVEPQTSCVSLPRMSVLLSLVRSIQSAVPPKFATKELVRSPCPLPHHKLAVLATVAINAEATAIAWVATAVWVTASKLVAKATTVPMASLAKRSLQASNVVSPQVPATCLVLRKIPARKTTNALLASVSAMVAENMETSAINKMLVQKTTSVFLKRMKQGVARLLVVLLMAPQAASAARMVAVMQASNVFVLVVACRSVWRLVLEAALQEDNARNLVVTSQLVSARKTATVVPIKSVT